MLEILVDRKGHLHSHKLCPNQGQYIQQANGHFVDVCIPHLQIFKMADEIVNGTEKVHFSSFKGDVIVCCGGFEGRFELDTVEAFCVTTNTWADLPPMPVECDSLAAGSYGSAVFIAGGSDR